MKLKILNINCQSLYDTVNVDGANKINLEEDYDMDGIPTLGPLY